MRHGSYGRAVDGAMGFCDLWNARVPIGTPLLATLPDGTEVKTRRTCAASEMAGAASLYIAEAGGWVPLRNIRPLTDTGRQDL